MIASRYETAVALMPSIFVQRHLASDASTRRFILMFNGVEIDRYFARRLVCDDPTAYDAFPAFALVADEGLLRLSKHTSKCIYERPREFCVSYH